MDYNEQHFGSSSNDLPEVTSSGEPATSFASYPATSASWSAIQDPHGSSSTSYSSHGLPTYGSSGYYPAGTGWSANPFESSFQGATAMNYSNPSEMYNYTYHQGASPFSASTSPTYTVDGSSAMGMDPSDNMSVASGHHHSHHSHHHHHKKEKESSRKQKPSKHQKSSFFSPLSPSSASSSSTPTASKSKLRSASRTSKNTHHNPPATEEERRNRESHNQVEKQYRNRLNMHFESLLNALPENMRGGGGEEDEEGEMDAGGGGSGDRRVSKAEVLDMARRHIQTLEQECSALEGERDELRDNMEKLQWLFKKCGGDEGARGGGFQGSMGA